MTSPVHECGARQTCRGAWVITWARGEERARWVRARNSRSTGAPERTRARAARAWAGRSVAQAARLTAPGQLHRWEHEA
eukprot:CAMPEP_0185193146 /NCGR_PEP_ID=MMETSP1140-20130426/22809_1 /TAXON_ID=298111 /ORGANISM="Pavlova sp., Strain CCMP459" /LENGTH=78 /DNA_ID=CAMNT_0027759929 /DNA_START=28 /DNA_END=261 /DNA_ORIENTATION=-